MSGDVGLMVPVSLAPFSERLRLVRAAEDARLHSVWTGDHFGDVFSLLTAYAMHTASIRLGAGVAVWHRPPILTANAAAQLQQLSGERFMLGLGAGPKQWNEDWWGLRFDRPVRRMREYVAVVRGAVATPPGQAFDFDGRHFTVRGFQRPTGVWVGTPPVWLGTVGRQMTRLAGEIADGALLDVCLPLGYLREVALPALDAGLHRSERPRRALTVAALVACVVDDDRAEAHRWLKEAIVGHLGVGYLHEVWANLGFGAEADAALSRLRNRDHDGAVAAVSNDFAAAVGIAGSADECRARVAEYLELVDLVVVWTPPAEPGAPLAERTRRLIETFSKSG